MKFKGKIISGDQLDKITKAGRNTLLGIFGGGLGTLAYGIVIGIVAWKKK